MSKILIVDDDPSFLEATQILMEHEGHQVECVSGGKKGFVAALARHPDLIILDVMMETILAGVKVSWDLHSNPDTSDIPILMVSAITQSEQKDIFPEDQNNYVDTCLHKPVDPKIFIEHVRRLLA